MKRMHFLPVLLILSIMALVSVVNAQTTYTYYPTLWIQFKPNNFALWWFNTAGVGWSFSGKDVDTTVAQYMIYIGDPNNPVEEWHSIKPKNIHLKVDTVNTVTLVFESAVLPPYANGTMVSGTLTNGETFLAAGPGFAWWAPT